MTRLLADGSLLLVIDMQERLLPAIAGGALVVDRVAALMAAADQLAVPVLATEQYPRGLGPTVPGLAAALGDRRLEKLSFSALGEPAVVERLDALGPDSAVVVCGVEAHVCVLQTVLDLAGRGKRVAMVADATGSRRAEDRQLALDRARAHGADVVGTEMVLFEWLGRADNPGFRALQPLIKGLAGS